MARNDPQVAVRLPPDVKSFIKAEAQANASSQNSEIVRAIRERMQRAALEAAGIQDQPYEAKGAASVAADPRQAINP